MSNKFVSWKSVDINKGFWKQWQNVVAQNTSKVIYDRFNSTGRIDAMKLLWKEGMPNKPHVFWDSDIAKWMEGSSYILYYHKDEELLQNLENIIDMIENGQTSDGYFNSAFLTLDPKNCFKDRTNHELYTAGHFFEAAVAHYYSTESDRFLNIMCKFADYIYQVFKEDNSANYKTPGHQEIELALFRLYEATGNKKYLELSQHFVETRGTDKNERVFSVPNGVFPALPALQNQLLYNDTYAQDDAPARELPGAAGHAVRAMYFYTAMADISKECNDSELFSACKRLWNDSALKKMYVTGGISAERYGEAIGTSYVLPNDYSYAETCASVAMANFSTRMFNLEANAKYADMIELQMYNGALVGLSIDGKGFFYDNAMLSRPEVYDFFNGINATPLLPAYVRQELFECSCCPPNIYRFIAAIGQYFYSVDGSTVYVHQYTSNNSSVLVNEKIIGIIQDTNYPFEGVIKINFDIEIPCETTVALRIPAWCDNYNVKLNGRIQDELNCKDGYIYITRNWSSKDELLLEFELKIIQIEGNPNIVDTNGKVALKRGPLVYCLEGMDNSFNIFGLIIPKDALFSCKKLTLAGTEIIAIEGIGMLPAEDEWENRLYKPFSDNYDKVNFTAVPYYAWANRSKNNMTIWINKQR